MEDEMADYRIFEKPDGRKVAVNPDLVEALVVLSGHVQIKLSSGERVPVKKMALEEAIARLSGAAPM
jgi:hypothetical protein